MNTPNPLVPQGLQLEQKNNARSRVKLAIFFVLTIHVVGIMALLVQGCRPEEQEVVEQPIPEIPIFDPGETVLVDTNAAILPPVTNMPSDNGGWPDQGAYLPPPATNTPTFTTEPVMQEYIIQKGDTYYSIGKKFNVTMKAIQDANPGVDPTRLQVGKSILVPPPAASRPQADVVPTASGEIIYTVVSGDTLSKIASQYGTTWQAIRDLNKLPTTNIKVGQQLRIPVPKPAEGAPGGGMNY